MSPEDGEKIRSWAATTRSIASSSRPTIWRSSPYEGAVRRYGDPIPDDVKERVKFELHIMKTIRLPWLLPHRKDFINSARDELGVMVGPGRGSAAGSVLAYCLGITKIDPLKYDLLFERFLKSDRISLPDIDTDFDDDGRGKECLSGSVR